MENDLISRADAIDVVKGIDSYFVKYIEELPSAEPERKMGKWKRRLVDSGYNVDWYCSVCKWKTSLEQHGYNYCPNCGAKMGEVES